MVCSQLQPKMLPPEVDFTRVLPRNICLKIMSYLDPQSLCRAAQVCDNDPTCMYNSITVASLQVSWHWRYVSEHNNVWKTKCLMQGWFLPSPPNQYDISVWKRHYVACIRQLYWKLPQVSSRVLHMCTLCGTPSRLCKCTCTMYEPSVSRTLRSSCYMLI